MAPAQPAARPVDCLTSECELVILPALLRTAALYGLRRLQFHAPCLQRLTKQAFDFAIYAPQVGGGAALDRVPEGRIDP